MESIKSVHLSETCLSVPVGAYGFITVLLCVNVRICDIFKCMCVNVHV